MHEDKSVEANFGEKHADLNYFGRERVSHVEKHIYHVSQTIEREVREEEKKTPPQSHTHTYKTQENNNIKINKNEIYKGSTH